MANNNKVLQPIIKKLNNFAMLICSIYRAIFALCRPCPQIIYAIIAHKQEGEVSANLS